jgi:DNA repair protein RadC
MISKASSQKDIEFKDSRQGGEYFRPFFYGEKEEKVYVASIDSQLRLIRCHRLFDGSVNSAAVSARKIVETALADRATFVIMAHNHPTGLAVPSYEDKETTVRIAKALKSVEIKLLDHFVVAGSEFISMRDAGFFTLI